MKRVLENILQPLIGVSLIVLYSVWIINNYPQYSKEMMIICAVLSIAIITCRIGDLAIRNYIKKPIMKLWIVRFATSSIVYFSGFIIIRHIANMPAKISLVLCISLGYALIHIMLGSIIERMISDVSSLLPVSEKNNL